MNVAIHNIEFHEHYCHISLSFKFKKNLNGNTKRMIRNRHEPIKTQKQATEKKLSLVDRHPGLLIFISLYFKNQLFNCYQESFPGQWGNPILGFWQFYTRLFFGKLEQQ